MNAANYRKWGVQRNQSGDTDFSIWAPASATVKLWLNDAEFDMQTAGNGWHNATKPTSAGDRYGFILDDGTRVADPASNQQDEGPLGPSLIVNHDFHWKNPDWKGRPWLEAVVYELHVGTFTKKEHLRPQEARISRRHRCDGCRTHAACYLLGQSRLGL